MRNQLLTILLAIAMLAGACGSGSEDAVESADPAAASQSDDAASNDDATSNDAANDDAAADTTSVDYELFSSDEGAGCGVYISVPESVVDEGANERNLIWQGVIANDFSSCGLSEVNEVGLITVNGLDNYNQPDWSTAIEHAFFTVADWDGLVADCYDSSLSDACQGRLADSFVP